MNYFIKAYKKHPVYNTLYNPCGSDHNWIITDLKTIKGVMNRLNKSVMMYELNNNKIELIRIFTYSNLYDDNSYKFIDEITATI